MATKSTTHTERGAYTDYGTVVGAFHSPAEAQRAVRELKAAGFDDSQIGIASRGEEGDFEKQAEGNKAGEGAAIGATAGLGAGALWGLGIVAGVLPAIGPVIAGGALAAIIASAAGTAVAGGLIGGLVGMGIPEEEAEYYHGEFEQGRTIVTVKASGADAIKARRIMDQSNAYDFRRRESEYARNPRAQERMDAEGRMVARKEILNVDKHAHDVGEAKVRKEVHTETKHMDVPVKREELVVERTPLHGQEVGEIGSGTEEERIRLREEEVNVGKRTVGKEAVKVGKRTTTEKKPVDVELKEEEIVVEDEHMAHSHGHGRRR